MIILAVIALAIGGYVYSQPRQDKMAPKDTMVKEEVMVKTDDVMVKEEDQMMVVKDSSRYLPYTQASYNSAQGKRVVLYFYATWCPSCKVANAEFLASPEKIPEDVIVLRVNYSDPDTDADEKALATKYGITYQHTFVQIDAEGNVVTKWNGGSVKELLANIK
jgi:thiol-disulfide isomerase/thioredoxin